jgi:hypothetical protein
MSVYFWDGLLMHECPRLDTGTIYPVRPRDRQCFLCGERYEVPESDLEDLETETQIKPKETA